MSLVRTDQDECDETALTVIAKATLVKPKGPVRHFSRQPNNLGILTCDLGRITLAASEEIKVQHPANDIILERRSPRARVGNLNIHTVGVEEEHAVGACCAVFKVNRVISIEV